MPRDWTCEARNSSTFPQRESFLRSTGASSAVAPCSGKPLFEMPMPMLKWFMDAALIPERTPRAFSHWRIAPPWEGGVQSIGDTTWPVPVPGRTGVAASKPEGRRTPPVTIPGQSLRGGRIANAASEGPLSPIGASRAARGSEPSDSSRVGVRAPPETPGRRCGLARPLRIGLARGRAPHLVPTPVLLDRQASGNPVFDEAVARRARREEDRALGGGGRAPGPRDGHPAPGRPRRGSARADRRAVRARAPGTHRHSCKWQSELQDGRDLFVEHIRFCIHRLEQRSGLPRPHGCRKPTRGVGT